MTAGETSAAATWGNAEEVGKLLRCDAKGPYPEYGPLAATPDRANIRSGAGDGYKARLAFASPLVCPCVVGQRAINV